MAANPSGSDVKVQISDLKYRLFRTSMFDLQKPAMLTHLSAVIMGGLPSNEGDVIIDLGTAIGACEEAIQIADDSNPILSATLFILSQALRSRFEISYDEDDLDLAIETALLAIQLIPGDNRDHSHSVPPLNALFLACMARFDRRGNVRDVNLAIVAAEQAVDLTPDGHSNKPACLNKLGSALQTRFKRLGKLEDLEQAIVSLRRAVDLTPDGHPDKPSFLSNLGLALQARFGRLGKLEDLQKAIVSMCRAVDLTPDGHPDKPACLNNLGIALETRFGRLGELEDLEQAIVFKYRAVDLTPDGHPKKPSCLNNLGVALEKRFGRLGELEDLEQAIVFKYRAVDLTPDGHPDRPRWLNNLGSALEKRFGRLGELEDLEQAVVFERRAVNLTPDGHPEKPICLDSLGNALETRFGRLGELEDLEQAIISKRRAVDLTPDGHPDKPSRLNNLGITLETRFDRLGELEDLEQAIVSKRRAVDLTPDDHPDKPSRLNNLGNALNKRFDRLGEFENLEQAIVSMRRAVDLTPDGHPDKPACLNNLGIALGTRFDRLGELEDLEQAIVSKHRAVELTPDGHPDKPARLIMLVKSLLSRKGMDLHDNIDQCLPLLLSAADQQSGPPSIRLNAVRHASDLGWIAIRSQAANVGLRFLVQVYERAFELIPQVAWLGKSIAQRYEDLAKIGQLVNGAAAAAIAIGDHARAVEWLDQGRSVVWGQLLQLRNPMDDLHAYDSAHGSNFANKLRSISSQLEHTGRGDEESVEDKISSRIRLEKEYQALLALVRALDGFENFLLPKKYGELIHAANNGLVVIINVHKSRCDALVVSHRSSQDHPLHVPLPALSLELVDSMRSQFIHTLKQAGVRERAGVHATSHASISDRGIRPYRFEHRSGLANVLASLWSSVVYPIIQALEGELHELAVDSLPHITWCATGPLAFLPIHAAGEYGSLSRGGLKLFDIAVSSYTPTLSALLRPPLQHLPDLRSPSTKILVISQPETPGLNPLPGTRDEVNNLRRHFPGDTVIHLDHTDATVGAVQQAISQHGQLVHLACHGIQDVKNPRDSSFALQDGKLKLSEIMSRSNDDAVLAFLSACQTATGDEKLPDEAVHLAAGMLSSGYRSVIGTMWSIGDRDAPLVADEFYRYLKGDEGMKGGRLRAAYALHEAVKVLREKVGESNFVRWAPFVHFGL